MSDASDSAQSPKLVDSAPEAKRRHHAPAPSPTKSGAALVAAPRAEKPPDAPSAAAPKREVTAADPVAEQHIRGALHSVCRSVDRYTKITQIGKGTYGLVSSRFLLHPFFFFACFTAPCFWGDGDTTDGCTRPATTTLMDAGSMLR